MQDLLAEIDSFKEDLASTSDHQLKHLGRREHEAKKEMETLRREMFMMAESQSKYKSTIADL